MPAVATFDRVDVVDASGDLEVPAGMQVVTIWVVGAGGAGSTGTYPAGGGAGGVAVREYPVLEGDWGTSLTVVVGVGAANADGTATSVEGAINGATIENMFASGGLKALVSGGGGAGGIALGGSINSAGLIGTAYDSENNIVGSGAQISDASVQTYISAEIYGKGGDGDTSQSIAGGPGIAIFYWRN